MFSIQCNDIDTLFQLCQNALYEGWQVQTMYYKDGSPKVYFDKPSLPQNRFPDKRWVEYTKSVGAVVKLPVFIPRDAIFEDWEDDKWTLRPVEEVELQKAADAKWADDVRQAWGEHTEDGWIDPISGIKF